MAYAKILSCCAVVALASPAVARPPVYVIAPPEDAVTRHISYADLNLASAEGARTLYNRVDAAVGDLCDEAAGGNDGGPKYKFNMARCSSAAWRQAQPQIDQAVRAFELAATGSSTVAATAVIISLP